VPRVPSGKGRGLAAVRGVDALASVPRRHLGIIVSLEGGSLPSSKTPKEQFSAARSRALILHRLNRSGAGGGDGGGSVTKGNYFLG